jgi:hypothetical protein
MPFSLSTFTRVVPQPARGAARAIASIAANGLASRVEFEFSALRDRLAIWVSPLALNPG